MQAAFQRNIRNALIEGINGNTERISEKKSKVVKKKND